MSQETGDKRAGRKRCGAITSKLQELRLSVVHSIKYMSLIHAGTKSEPPPLAILNDETSGSSKTSVCFTELHHHQSALRRCHNLSLYDEPLLRVLVKLRGFNCKKQSNQCKKFKERLVKIREGFNKKKSEKVWSFAKPTLD